MTSRRSRHASACEITTPPVLPSSHYSKPSGTSICRGRSAGYIYVEPTREATRTLRADDSARGDMALLTAILFIHSEEGVDGHQVTLLERAQ